MPKWVHRLTERNLDTMTAICAACGPVEVQRSGPRRNVRCANAIREYNAKYVDKVKRSGISHARRLHLKDACERCGFLAEHPCQLHIDHINGDWKDDVPENWQTLCQNCHALKTQQEKTP